MMFNMAILSKKRLSVVFLISVFFVGFSSVCFSQEQSFEKIETLARNAKIRAPQAVLKDFRDGKPTARVIVNLRKPSTFSGNRNMGDMKLRQEQEQSINKAQESVIGAVDPIQVRITNRFKYIFGFSVEVSLEGLQNLTDNPDVLSIENDEVLHAHLAQGIPLMNGTTARSSYNGSGLAIAICDTGIDYTHTKLGGGGFPNSKVIGGYDCGDDDNDPMDQDGHGTACAGVAAGDLDSDGDYIGGVAYNARLYAVKISHGSGGSAYVSDMIEAWEWCITHQNDDPDNPIVIISTSFGGGRYYSTCDSDTTAMTTAAANAVSAGMTLFVSSGNDGYCDATGWPSCVSYVISVGAVYDANFTFSSIGWCVSPDSCATKVSTSGCSTGCYAPEVPDSDSVTVYSNTASFLSLLAPSNWATTTKMGGGYWTSAYGFGGTSAACPYAAGAAACLQSANKVLSGSFLTPAQVKAILCDTGDAITDGKVSITKPRVNLGAAVETLTSGMTVISCDDLSSEGNSGGPFSPAGITYILENQKDIAISYSVSKSASWVSISDTGGSLAGHATTGVTVSINSNADSLPKGIYTDTIYFTNTTDHAGDIIRVVTLTVGVPSIQYSWNMDTDPGWATEGLWHGVSRPAGVGRTGTPIRPAGTRAPMFTGITFRAITRTAFLSGILRPVPSIAPECRGSR
ncbi:MAG: S8 family serine peptidase [Deltaproteobacteria bacterium]|nr:S8 family serine peptidase [Deltaproteobacteria bacterium]